MSRRKPFVRPLSKTWYMKDPWYTRYMVREASSVFVTIYCLILLGGLWALLLGPDTYEGWVALVTSPLSVLFHVVALIMTLVHMVTWFKLVPVVMPTQFGNFKMPAGDLLVKAHYGITALVSIVFLFLAI